MAAIVSTKHTSYAFRKRTYLYPTIFQVVFCVSLYSCGGHVYHVVEPGETLYSIGWLYGYDYRIVAKWNNIYAPYRINSGQRIRVAPIDGEKKSLETVSSKNKSVNIAAKESVNVVANSKQNKRNTHVKNSTKKSNKAVVWSWPTRGGKIIQTFDSKHPARKGLDLAGHIGQPVFSASAGKVVYSGNGIGRYGKLVIVKHNQTYLSAYAHNKKLLVKEGDVLKSGQKIAEMGSSGTNRTKLHFEIRRNGKPVDPLRFLPKINP